MSNIRAKVLTGSEIKTRVGVENTIRTIPTVGLATLGALTDVDLTNIDNGYVLVYDEYSQKN